ncbi:unnamed protein product, partial [Protopolystoma xenopodis]
MNRAFQRIKEERQQNDAAVSAESANSAGEESGAGKTASDDYYHGLSVTVRYNQARLHEAMSRPDLAEEMYKAILSEHPCY